MSWFNFKKEKREVPKAQPEEHYHLRRCSDVTIPIDRLVLFMLQQN